MNYIIPPNNSQPYSTNPTTPKISQNATNHQIPPTINNIKPTTNNKTFHITKTRDAKTTNN
ncbi:hypothetical protein AAHH80_36720, partial [Burkholderia pseudomallei]